MKILCISNIVEWADPGGRINSKAVSHLTIGKWYELIEEDCSLYMVWNDVGCDQYYQKRQNNFINQKEYRKLKLQKINDIRR